MPSDCIIICPLGSCGNRATTLEQHWCETSRQYVRQEVLLHSQGFRLNHSSMMHLFFLPSSVAKAPLEPKRCELYCATGQLAKRPFSTSWFGPLP